MGAAGVDAISALRDGIAKGYVPGPRFLASSKTITPTGGHADGSQGYRSDLIDRCRLPVRVMARLTVGARCAIRFAGVPITSR